MLISEHEHDISCYFLQIFAILLLKPMNEIKSNIEVAHIYADQKHIGAEQREAFLHLNFLQKKDLINLKEATTSVWIDDYNPKIQLLDIQQFMKSARDLYLVDFFASEKNVAAYVEQYLHLLEKSQSDYYIKFFHKNGKYPCSLVTAIWYLIRLGFIRVSDDFFLRRYSEKQFTAHEIINILPRKYETVENKTKSIFASNITISKFLSHIHTYYF